MKQFFISFFANLAAISFFLFTPFCLLLILLIAVSVNPNSRIATVKDNSILVVDLSMNLTDSPEHATDTDPLSSAFSGDTTLSLDLYQTIQAIHKAANDSRIKAIFLRGSLQPAGFGSGYASLKEFREALLDFRHKGKRIIAYLEGPSTKDYYVATVADTIYLNPFGELEVPGLASEKMYFLNAFQKYGIQVQVTRVGKYKSAVEPFILNKMSDADREETQKLLQDLWGEFVATVAAARKIDSDQFQQLVDSDGFITAEHAVDPNNHLVDKLAYFGDVLNELGQMAPSGETGVPFQQVALVDYMNLDKTKLNLKTQPEVAVLYLEGEIVDGWGDQTNIGGDRFAAQIRQLIHDDNVKSVVVRVNSPGGSAFASEVIQRELRNLRARKPVIISMGAYAASGGYWVSTFGNYIFAEPNTLTGSIGVFGLFFNVQKLSDTVGISWDTAKTGNYADFETITRPKTDQELALAQSRVDDIYGKFIARVSQSRGIPSELVEQIAQGRVWSGQEAIKIHLVDELGGLEKAINFAANRANLGTNYQVIEYPKQLTFAEKLAAAFDSEQEPLIKLKAKANPLAQQALKVQDELKTLQNFNDPLNAYARLPLGFDVK